jgi:hypothetical protein
VAREEVRSSGTTAEPASWRTMGPAGYPGHRQCKLAVATQALLTLGLGGSMQSGAVPYADILPAMSTVQADREAQPWGSVCLFCPPL